MREPPASTLTELVHVCSLLERPGPAGRPARAGAPLRAREALRARGGTDGGTIRVEPPLLTECDHEWPASTEYHFTGMCDSALSAPSFEACPHLVRPELVRAERLIRVLVLLPI